MNQNIKRVYPHNKAAKCKLENLYLNPLLSKTYEDNKPIYYANFLSSLDGRIAIYNKKHRLLLTPDAIKNTVDFVLFSQLHAQADCLVTNTHYMKGLNKGYYGDILSVKNQKLVQWRKDNNIRSHKIIILSNSLDFPINKKLETYKDKIIILTTTEDLKKINKFKEKGYEIVKCRGKNVSAKCLNKCVIKNKLKSVYFIAGPTIVEQMMAEKLLDRFYYSTSMSLIGTQTYDTIIRGNFLKETVNLNLTEMFIHTEVKKDIATQTLFQVFDIKKRKK